MRPRGRVPTRLHSHILKSNDDGVLTMVCGLKVDTNDEKVQLDPLLDFFGDVDAPLASCPVCRKGRGA